MLRETQAYVLVMRGVVSVIREAMSHHRIEPLGNSFGATLNNFRRPPAGLTLSNRREDYSDAETRKGDTKGKCRTTA
jgi:hypothetical protein